MNTTPTPGSLTLTHRELQTVLGWYADSGSHGTTPWERALLDRIDASMPNLGPAEPEPIVAESARYIPDGGLTVVEQLRLAQRELVAWANRAHHAEERLARIVALCDTWSGPYENLPGRVYAILNEPPAAEPERVRVHDLSHLQVGDRVIELAYRGYVAVERSTGLAEPEADEDGVSGRWAHSRARANALLLGDTEPAEPESGDVLDALRRVVEKASVYGEDDDGFVNLYLLGTGAIHNAIRVLQEHGITARPASGPAEPEPGA